MPKEEKYVIGGCILVIAIGLAVWLAFPPGGKPQAKPFVPPRYYFARGTALPADFPQRLILGQPMDLAVATTSLPGVVVSASPMTDERIIWDTPIPMNVLMGSYQSYFKQANWTVTNEPTDDSSTVDLYAADGSSTATVSVAIQPSASGGSSVYMIYKP